MDDKSTETKLEQSLKQLDLRELEERLEVSPLNVLGELQGTEVDFPDEPLSCGWKIPICRIAPSTGPTNPDLLS